MQMSWQDFERVTLAEFLSAYEGYAQALERDQRTRMEVARWSALVDLCNNPWVKIDTSDIGSLLPLPWHDKADQTQQMTTEEEFEERRKRALELVEKYGKSREHTYQDKR